MGDLDLVAPETDMTPEEYREILAHHGLTQGQASGLLGVYDRTGQRYAAGTSAIPQLVARILRISLKRPQILKWLSLEIGD
jgi:hypothetical protein